MKRTRYSEEQIIHCPPGDLCCKHGLSEGTF